MAVSYIGKGTFASGTGALTVGVPSGYQDGDLFLMFCESENENISTPSGWSDVSGSPQGTGTAKAAGAVRLEVFYKWVSGTQSSVTVSDSGDHTTAIIACFRGVDSTTPFNVTAGSVDSSATSSLSCPSVTTTVQNCMIVNAIGLDKDLADTDTLSSWANSNLTSLTERHDQSVSSADGGGVAFATGMKSTAGSVGNTTATGDTSTTHAYLTIALQPFQYDETQLTQTILASHGKTDAMTYKENVSGYPVLVAQIEDITDYNPGAGFTYAYINGDASMMLVDCGPDGVNLFSRSGSVFTEVTGSDLDSSGALSSFSDYAIKVTSGGDLEALVRSGSTFVSVDSVTFNSITSWEMFYFFDYGTKLLVVGGNGSGYLVAEAFSLSTSAVTFLDDYTVVSGTNWGLENTLGESKYPYTVINVRNTTTSADVLYLLYYSGGTLSCPDSQTVTGISESILSICKGGSCGYVTKAGDIFRRYDFSSSDISGGTDYSGLESMSLNTLSGFHDVAIMSDDGTKRVFQLFSNGTYSAMDASSLYSDSGDVASHSSGDFCIGGSFPTINLLTQNNLQKMLTTQGEADGFAFFETPAQTVLVAITESDGNLYAETGKTQTILSAITALSSLTNTEVAKLQAIIATIAESESFALNEGEKTQIILSVASESDHFTVNENVKQVILSLSGSSVSLVANESLSQDILVSVLAQSNLEALERLYGALVFSAGESDTKSMNDALGQIILAESGVSSYMTLNEIQDVTAIVILTEVDSFIPASSSNEYTEIVDQWILVYTGGKDIYFGNEEIGYSRLDIPNVDWETALFHMADYAETVMHEGQMYGYETEAVLAKDGYAWVTLENKGENAVDLLNVALSCSSSYPLAKVELYEGVVSDDTEYEPLNYQRYSGEDSNVVFEQPVSVSGGDKLPFTVLSLVNNSWCSSGRLGNSNPSVALKPNTMYGFKVSNLSPYVGDATLTLKVVIVEHREVE